MAQTDFQFKIFINDKSAGKKFFRLKTGESLDHVILKLIAFILFFDCNPSIEESIDWRYKPDLVAFDGYGKITLWVECSDVAPEKIRKVLQKYRKLRLVVLKITEGEARIFSQIFAEDKNDEPAPEVIGFDRDFIDQICSKIYDRISINAFTDGNNLEISFDGMKVSSKIYSF